MKSIAPIPPQSTTPNEAPADSPVGTHTIIMPEQPPSGTAERLALADRIDGEQKGIVTEWMNAVREDPEIPSADQLTLKALEDHLPNLLGELVSTLRARDDEASNAPEIRETSREHGKARWDIGYRFDELLRELARVRETLLARTVRFFRENPSAEAREISEQKIRRFFDVVIVTSAQQFMEEQKAEVLLRSQQLQSAYEQVQAATDQLRAVAQSRLRLLRGVSHELRNAMQTVELAASGILQETDPQSRHSMSAHLTGGAARLQQLLDRLREFSTILAGETRLELRPLDLRAFLDELKKTHGPNAAGKGLVFQGEGDRILPLIVTDHAKLRNIADILLSNAIEYTAHGTIRVEVLLDRPGRWVLRVDDSGSGIDPRSAHQVFSEFHRLSESDAQGLGLGLVIARHLAHLMDAEITFQSTMGQGSRFEANFPLELMEASVPPDPLEDR